eukprot:g28377.t1
MQSACKKAAPKRWQSTREWSRWRTREIFASSVLARYFAMATQAVNGASEQRGGWTQKKLSTGRRGAWRPNTAMRIH